MPGGPSLRRDESAHNPRVTARDVRDLLLAPRLEPGDVAALLGAHGLRDAAAADRNLQSMAADPLDRKALAEILPELLLVLSRSADPDQGLNLLERYVRASLNPRSLFIHFKADLRCLEVLVLTCGASPFLAEILIRSPAWLYWLTDPAVLARPRGTREIAIEVDRALRASEGEELKRDALRVVKRRELLHIGVRDLLRLASVEETLLGLTRLADVLVRRAFDVSDEALRREHGLPARRSPRDAFCVLGLGKLGGEELNFSSDVDLVYVFASEDGRLGRRGAGLPRDQYAKQLARRLTAALGDVTAQGSVYRVDLRLRPEGQMGKLAVTVAAAEDYYRERASTWERLALVKARPVAGDRALGQSFLRRVQPFVYGRPFGPDDLAAMREVKRGIDKKVAARAETHRHVKLGFGGIREIEFAVQVLQLRHGRRVPRLRRRATLEALAALRETGRLEEAEARDLERAYLFLRDVENKLQMVADTQTHTLPDDAAALRTCALRLGYQGPGPAEEALLADYRRHTEAAHRVFRRVMEEG